MPLDDLCGADIDHLFGLDRAGCANGDQQIAELNSSSR